ncbi:hypothetical protein H4R33_005281 [Dimargaris cristalligena]|nr:hypothetical protein H4R33_005281 [Dimargaris cristalligena]
MNHVPKFIPASKITTVSEVDRQLHLVQQEVQLIYHRYQLLVAQNRLTPDQEAEFKAQVRSLESRKRKYLDRRLLLIEGGVRVDSPVPVAAAAQAEAAARLQQPTTTPLPGSATVNQPPMRQLHGQPPGLLSPTRRGVKRISDSPVLLSSSDEDYSTTNSPPVLSRPPPTSEHTATMTTPRPSRPRKLCRSSSPDIIGHSQSSSSTSSSLTSPSGGPARYISGPSSSTEIPPFFTQPQPHHHIPGATPSTRNTILISPELSPAPSPISISSISGRSARSIASHGSEYLPYAGGDSPAFFTPTPAYRYPSEMPRTRSTLASGVEAIDLTVEPDDSASPYAAYPHQLVDMASPYHRQIPHRPPMWAPSAPNYPFLPSYGSPQTPGPPPVQPYVIYQRDPAGRIIGVVSPGQSTVPISPSPLRLGPGGTVLPGVFLPTNPECHTEDVRKLVGNINFDEPHQQARLDTPKDLSISLLEHQKIGLTWMIKMELSRMKGGILADDMGLGKTVQSMALIVTRRPENPSQSQAEPVSPNGTSSSQTTHSTAATSKTPVSSVPSSPSSTPRPRDYYTTLIVAPLSLVYQWKREIDTKTRNNCLRVYVYHGASRERRPHILTGYDVVVTTYNLLTSESPRETPAPTEPGPLFRIKYWRIILDEAQVIKNRAAKSSIAVAKLQSRYKWCLSGTPIQNSIDELYPPVRFLGIKPYNQWDAFRRDISGPAQSANLTPRAFQRVQALLKAILLRRRKTDQIDGKPILSLPGKTVHEVKENFTTPEAEFYKSVQERSEELFQSMMDANAVMKNYANILVMILRLRQACCHPLLVLDRQHRDHLARYYDRIQSTGAFAEYFDNIAKIKVRKRDEDAFLEMISEVAASDIKPDLSLTNSPVETPNGQPYDESSFPSLSRTVGIQGSNGPASGGSPRFLGKAPATTHTQVKFESDCDTDADLPSAHDIMTPGTYTKCKTEAAWTATDVRVKPDPTDSSVSLGDADYLPNGDHSSWADFNCPADWNPGHRSGWQRLSLEAKSQLDRADLTSILCLLCDDISTNPVILSPCGHIYCEECVETQVNNHIEDSEPACPRCQHRFSLKQAIPVGLLATSSHMMLGLSSNAPSLSKILPLALGTSTITTRSRTNGSGGVGTRSGNRRNGTSGGGGGGGGGSGGGGIQPITHYDDDGANSTHGLSPSSFIPSSKIIRTLRIIRETRADQPTDKFVVFSQFTQMLLLVSRALAREHIPHFIFDGSVAPMEREDMVKQFYDRPDVPVMLISMKCGSVGLNLCCANHVILLDLWWNPALEDQATDRVHRIGQTKPVTVHRITIPDTIEDRILHLQADKRDIIKRAFGEGDSEKLGRLSYQDLVYLFRG